MRSLSLRSRIAPTYVDSHCSRGVRFTFLGCVVTKGPVRSEDRANLGFLKSPCRAHVKSVGKERLESNKAFSGCREFLPCLPFLYEVLSLTG